MAGLNSVGQVLPILGGVASTVQTLQNDFDTIRNFGADPQAEAQARAAAAEDARREQLIAEQDLALAQLQQKQQAQEAQLAQQSALQREKLAADAKQAEEDRQQALRRAVARQRAQFGARGISSTGGSGEAVLLGFFEESDEQHAERERLDNLRTQSIDLDQSQASSLNLLQATQLAERQRLQRLF